MGLILDSSVLIAAERKGQTVRQVLLDVGSLVGREDVAVSVVTLIELGHGVARAETQQRREVRQQFLDELMIALPVPSVSVSVALRAGRIDGELAAQGVRLALADLLIGVTALELGYGVGTGNLRHFKVDIGAQDCCIVSVAAALRDTGQSGLGVTLDP